MRESTGLPEIITFSGIDEATNIDYLCDLSQQYPSVEWNLHYYPEIQGAPGYPKRDWVQKFLARNLKTSVQLSGQVIYEIILHPSRAASFIMTLNKFSRVQLNVDVGNSFFNCDTIKNIYDIFYDFGVHIVIPITNYTDKEVLKWILSKRDISLLYSPKPGTAYNSVNKWYVPSFIAEGNRYRIGFNGNFSEENVIFELYDINILCNREKLNSYWINMGNQYSGLGRFDLFKAEDVLRKIYEQSR